MSLLENAEAATTPLLVYCDGARRPDDFGAVAAVRDYVESIRGFASITRVYRPENLGLARSVVDAVTWTLKAHDRVIVLEDDLVVSRHFLRFMNEGLASYAEDQRVASIHGYCFPSDQRLPQSFFLRGADCWGWATWRRAWQVWQPDGAALLRELRERGLTHNFDLDGAFPYTRMLREQIAGRNDSWAIRWHAACYLADMLTLYPGRSLVHNIGNDASGTHSGASTDFDQAVAVEPIPVERIELKESAVGRAAFQRFYRKRRRRTLQRWTHRLLFGLRVRSA